MQSFMIRSLVVALCICAMNCPPSSAQQAAGSSGNPVSAQNADADFVEWQASLAKVQQTIMSGDLKDAETLARQTIQLRQKLGLPPPLDAGALIALTQVQGMRGDFSSARRTLATAEDLIRQAFSDEEGAIAPALATEGLLDEMMGDIPAASEAYQKSWEIAQKAGMADRPEATGITLGLADVNVFQGNLQEAEDRCQQVLKIQERAFGARSILLQRVLNLLATIYGMQGQLEQAEIVLQRSIEIGTANLPVPQLALGYAGLALVYLSEGKFREAEDATQSAIRTSQSVPGGDANLPYFKVLLGEIYNVQGRSAEAQTIFQDQLVYARQHNQGNGFYAAMISEFLADSYDDDSKAVPLLTDARTVLTQQLGVNSPAVVGTSVALAGALIRQQKYTEAEEMLQDAIRIEKHTGAGQGELNAAALSGLGWSLQEQEQFSPAAAMYQKSLASQMLQMGTSAPLVGSTELDLAGLYRAWGKPDEAARYFAGAEQVLHHQFQYSFTYMSEKDRLAFLKSERAFFGEYLSFCLERYPQHRSVAGDVYDLLLWDKGMVADSIAAQRARLRASGDMASVMLLDQILVDRNRYAALAASPPAAAAAVPVWKSQLDQLQQKTNGLEEQLVRSSTLPGNRQITWHDVQRALKPNEVAVEVVRFHVHDALRWTSHHRYAALVLKGGTAPPELIDLGDAGQLEDALRAEYYPQIAPPAEAAGTLLDASCTRGETGTSATTTGVAAPTVDVHDLYNRIWKPLEPALGRANRVYLATDGALNQVAVGLIPAPDGQMLQEKLDVRLVNRTADLVEGEPAVRTAASAPAVLFANPDFRLSEANYRQTIGELKIPEAASGAGPVPTIGMRKLNLGTCAELPQVHALEVGLQSRVAPMLTDHGFAVESYFQNKAMVEALENIRGPRLLHIATHGDFLADPTVADGGENSLASTLMSDPMLRSRLYFTGAQHTLNGDNWPLDLSDGILTAYQASMLNLHGTELVILSACETGRGKVLDGEGVFGLRRAFQEAGAESVMMTLWEVPAAETQELLERFYQHWLVDGMEKHQALRQAQRDEREIVRTRYHRDLPYYWGSFILVGR